MAPALSFPLEIGIDLGDLRAAKGHGWTGREAAKRAFVRRRPVMDGGFRSSGKFGAQFRSCPHPIRPSEFARGGRGRGAELAGLLAGLPAVVYGHKYLTLRSEDHALLLGSLLLFGALASAMIATRRFDWHAVGRRPPAALNSGGYPSTPTNRDA